MYWESVTMLKYKDYHGAMEWFGWKGVLKLNSIIHFLKNTVSMENKGNHQSARE